VRTVSRRLRQSIEATAESADFGTKHIELFYFFFPIDSRKMAEQHIERSDVEHRWR